jgi:glycerophosphoryl diester phosphodiesterase
MSRALLIAALICMAAAAFAADPPAAATKPLVIAHRGASGYLPEHTLEAYARAIVLGADFIEPDLVSTRDGVLIARHENELSDTTDVAEKFPDRKTKKTIDGRETEGWFSEDFTLAEIKTLRAKERLAFRGQADNGKFQVPTLAEVIALAEAEGAKRARAVGIYPETKHPTYFQQLGLALEPPLARALKAAGLDRADAPVFIQSFEIGNLKQLRTMVSAPLVQLLGSGEERPYDQEAQGGALTYGAMATSEGLRAIAAYAQGVGPFKGLIIPMDREGNLGAPTAFVREAHAAGLKVHPYTFRDEARYLAKPYGGDPLKEYCAFYALGIDGLFSDFPDTALKARDESCPMPR